MRKILLKPAVRSMSEYVSFCFVMCAVLAFLSFIFMSCSDDTSKQKSSRDIVYNNMLDGSVGQVKTWCEENLEDSGSLEFFRWGLVKQTENGFMVRSKYRFRNSSGEYVFADQIFYMDVTGKIIKVLDNK